MKALTFTLRGENAFFKIPEVNAYCYFSYGNIHKVALLGIFGALLGYGGYGQRKKDDEYPEFYEKLHNIEIAIGMDKKRKGYIQKKIHSFNNSVGYASQEEKSRGNLIIKEQWLENPRWEIYVKIDNEEAKKIADAIINKKAIFLPYLGSNDHPAIIEQAQIVDIKPEEEVEDISMDCLFPEHYFELEEDDDIIPFLYSEFLPVGLEQETNFYIREKIIFTNIPISNANKDIYKINGKYITFF